MQYIVHEHQLSGLHQKYHVENSPEHFQNIVYHNVHLSLYSDLKWTCIFAVNIIDLNGIDTPEDKHTYDWELSDLYIISSKQCKV